MVTGTISPASAARQFVFASAVLVSACQPKPQGVASAAARTDTVFMPPETVYVERSLTRPVSSKSAAGCQRARPFKHWTEDQIWSGMVKHGRVKGSPDSLTAIMYEGMCREMPGFKDVSQRAVSPCSRERPYKSWSNAELSAALLRYMGEPQAQDLIDEAACRQ